MLSQSSHIWWNNLILSELLKNSFFFLHKLKIFPYLKRKQSYDVLTWSSKNVFAIFADIGSKETDFFSKVGPLHE